MHNVKLHFETQAAAFSISYIQIVYLDNIVYSTDVRRTVDLNNAGPVFPYYRRYYILAMPPSSEQQVRIIICESM